MWSNFDNVLLFTFRQLLVGLIVILVALVGLSSSEADAADLIILCNITSTGRDATQTSFQVRFEFFFEVNRYRFAENNGSGWGAISPPQSFERADDDRIVLMVSGQGYGLIDAEIDRHTGAYTSIWHTTGGSIVETAHGYCTKFGSTISRF